MGKDITDSIEQSTENTPGTPAIIDKQDPTDTTPAANLDAPVEELPVRGDDEKTQYDYDSRGDDQIADYADRVEQLHIEADHDETLPVTY